MKKLVRDRIPDIIAASGRKCETRILSDSEYIRALNDKLDEELAEFHEAQNLEELADLTEVIRALSSALGFSPEQLEELRREKAENRGGFEQKIFLEKIIG